MLKCTCNNDVVIENIGGVNTYRSAEKTLYNCSSSNQKSCLSKYHNCSCRFKNPEFCLSKCHICSCKNSAINCRKNGYNMHICTCNISTITCKHYGFNHTCTCKVSVSKCKSPNTEFHDCICNSRQSSKCKSEFCPKTNGTCCLIS